MPALGPPTESTWIETVNGHVGWSVTPITGCGGLSVEAAVVSAAQRLAGAGDPDGDAVADLVSPEQDDDGRLVGRRLAVDADDLVAGLQLAVRRRLVLDAEDLDAGRCDAELVQRRHLGRALRLLHLLGVLLLHLLRGLAGREDLVSGTSSTCLSNR